MRVGPITPPISSVVGAAQIDALRIRALLSPPLSYQLRTIGAELLSGQLRERFSPFAIGPTWHPLLLEQSGGAEFLWAHAYGTKMMEWTDWLLTQL